MCVADRVFRIIAYIIIGFAFGAIFAHNNQNFQMGFSSALAVVLLPFQDEYQSNWWSPKPIDPSGVLKYDKARSYEGLTLYTSPDLQGARLIDMRGHERHRWQLDQKDLKDDFDASSIFGTGRLYWETAYLFSNGDLLATIVRDWTPYGYQLIKLDKNSRLLWKVSIGAHHDVSVNSKGQIFTLGQRIRETPVADQPQIVAPFLDDTVVVLSPEGMVERQVSIVDAFARSDYAAYLRLNPTDERGDILHANRAEVITASDAAVLPFAKAGQVLISLRNIHTIAILDLDSERITWATRGPWLFQHDPVVLPNGHLQIFDNWGNIGSGGASRVIEFDPLSMAITWSYAGSETDPLFSNVRSGAQRLPNGNTLICESAGGRLLEVTRSGDVVWEFVNPARSPDKALIGAIGLNVRRFDRASLPFLLADH